MSFQSKKNKEIPFDSNDLDYLRKVYIQYFEYVQPNSDLLRILFSRDDEINFSTKIAYRYKKYFLETIQINQHNKLTNPKTVLMIDYYTSGGVSFIKNWLLTYQNSISIDEAQNILWNLSSEINHSIDNMSYDF